MQHYAGVDVSLELSGVCVVDATGRIVRETKVASGPGAPIGWLRGLGIEPARVGLEAGPLPRWLCAAMRDAGLPVELLETRHVRDAFEAMPVKTTARTPAASGSCCGWAGSGPCTASRCRRKRLERC